jgi:hypothetical protein
MRKVLKQFFIFLLLIFFLFISYLFMGNPPPAEKITWGVTFSQKHTQNFDLNWQETYLALLEDLAVKNIKLMTHWDLLEPQKDEYFFDDLDWQIEKAKENGAKIIMVIGMKTGRWPECHLPDWAQNLEKEEQQEEILGLLEEIVLRYKDSPAIKCWQIENEPFFPFGECPWTDKGFLKEEIKSVKSLDDRKILISDSGEGSFWLQAAQLGDIVGTTMYRKVWVSFSWEKRLIPFFPKKLGFYFSYPLPPAFYWKKAQIIKKLFDKKVICVELQAEPWGPKLLYDSPLKEQEKTMNLEQFKVNIDFAKKTGLDEFYLWGSEWWYWMKTKQEQPQIWNEAKKLF